MIQEGSEGPASESLKLNKWYVDGESILFSIFYRLFCFDKHTFMYNTGMWAT